MSNGAYAFNYLDRVKHASLNEIACDTLTANGNVSVAGSLAINGTSYLNGSAQVQGGLTVASGSLVIAAGSLLDNAGNLSVGGTSTFGGNVQFDSGFIVSGGNLVSNQPAVLNSTLSVATTADIYDVLTLHRTGTALNLTSGNAVIAGQLAVGGAATFSNGIGVTGSASIAGGLLVSSGGLSVNGVITANNSINVAGGLTVVSGGLDVAAGDIDVSNNLYVSGNATVSGGVNMAGGNVVAGNNGIAYFGNADQIGFVWDGTYVQAYIDRTNIGPLLVAGGGSSPTFANLAATGTLHVSGTSYLNGSAQIGGGLTLSGGLSASGTMNMSGQIVCSAGGTQAIYADNGGIYSVGNVTAYGGNVNLGPYGISYMGGDQFGLTWSGATGSPGAINLYIDNVNEGAIPFSANLVWFKSNTVGGGPSGYTVDFNDVNGTTYRCFCDSVSDARLKENVRDSKVDALAAILAVPVRAFEWGEAARGVFGGDGSEIGIIAQEAAPHIKGIASVLAGQGNPNLPADLHYIHHDAAVPYLIRAIQQLHNEVQALKEESDARSDRRPLLQGQGRRRLDRRIAHEHRQ